MRFSKLLIKEINWQLYGKNIAKADFIAKDVEDYIDYCISEIKSRKKVTLRTKNIKNIWNIN